MITRRGALAVLAAGIPLAASLRTAAQTSDVPPLIGYLSQRSGPSVLEEAFRRGLRGLGYVEGASIEVDYRWAGFSRERLLADARDLVRRKVALIVATGGTATALLARKAAPATPVVFTGSDPVGSGLARSLAHPGGNATGISLYTGALSAKRLALLKETLPTIGRVGILSNPASPVNAPQIRDTRQAAPALGLEVLVEELRDPRGLDRAFADLGRHHEEALLVLSDPMFFEQRGQIVKLASRERLPGIYEFRDFVELGGLMSYGASIERMYERLATYVDKILKGARPADLPVEQPTTFELVINLKTARALGLAIPPSVLARADSVIE